MRARTRLIRYVVLLVVTILAVSVVSVRAARAATPSGYGKITAAGGKCLNDRNAKSAVNNPVQLWDCTGQGTNWRFWNNGQVHLAGSGLCLGTQDNKTVNGAALALRHCGDSSTYWAYDPGGSGLFMKLTGQSADNANNKSVNGNRLQVWAENGGTAQRWRVQPAADGGGIPRNAGSTGAFTTAGSNISRGGSVFVPYGVTLSTTQYPYGTYLDGPGQYSGNVPASDTANGIAIPPYLNGGMPPNTQQLKAQIDAAVAWHSNTVRLQVEQDELVYPHPPAGYDDSFYLQEVQYAVSYAESRHLAVILNDQTEPSQAYTRDEPLPTSDTVAFWTKLRQYANDQNVILDLFNEPRPVTGTTLAQMTTLWRDGGTYLGVKYLGHQQLAQQLRGLGFKNQLWVEPPGNYALSYIVSHPAMRLSGVTNVVYEYHHTTNAGQAHTPANWDTELGDLVKRNQAVVTDGEWTNRSIPAGDATPLKANKDAGQCWGDAPQSVPRYLGYLRQLGIGLSIWTFGTDASGNGFMNADDDPGTYLTANSYRGWPGSCKFDGPRQGAGQLVQAFFTARNP